MEYRPQAAPHRLRQGGATAIGYALDDKGGQDLNARVHTAEQALAGIWGSNVANPAAYPTNPLRLRSPLPKDPSRR